MRRLTISGQSGNSTIFTGEALENIKARLPAGVRVIIITDENVDRLYPGIMPSAERIVTGTTEAAKTLDTAAFIYRRLIEMQADRGVFLLGVGGGIVCDITGFVAATYLRGVRFATAPTTLLAQVDASVGGKTGVNFDGYKNMVGVFNQPEFVFCDPSVLKTLPGQEVANGFAEIVKHATIADDRYFDLIEQNADRALAMEPGLLEKIVYESVAIKAAVVNRDEREQGERRKLNFGHTLGHALEKTGGFSHGEAVSMGMAAAAWLSVQKGYLQETEEERIKSLLVRLGLPVRTSFDQDTVFEALARDKKRMDDSIHFVMLSAVGNSFVEPIDLSELRIFLERLSALWIT